MPLTVLMQAVCFVMHSLCQLPGACFVQIACLHIQNTTCQKIEESIKHRLHIRNFIIKLCVKTTNAMFFTRCVLNNILGRSFQSATV